MGNRSEDIIKWFENTMIDPDKIMDYFGVRRNKKKRAALHKIALDIRKMTYRKKSK